MTTNEKIMLSALRAIIARIDGVYDDPDLLAVGALCDSTTDDIALIAKVAIKAAKAGDDFEADVFKAYASTFGLTADDFGRTFKFRKRLYKITGCRPKSFKYPILGSRVPDGKTFKFPADHVAKNLVRD